MKSVDRTIIFVFNLHFEEVLPEPPTKSGAFISSHGLIQNGVKIRNRVRHIVLCEMVIMNGLVTQTILYTRQKGKRAAPACP